MKIHKGAFAVPQVTSIVDPQYPSTGVLQIQFFGEQQYSSEKTLEEGSISIIDLRDNQGGLWEEAVATLDLFFPKDTVLAYRQYSDGTKIPVLSQSSAVQIEPVVILINQGTKGSCGTGRSHIARKWYGDIGRGAQCWRSDRSSCLVPKSSTRIAHGRYTFVVV